MAWFYDTTQREDEIFPPEESFIAEGEILVEKWIPKEVKISIDNSWFILPNPWSVMK